MDTTLAPSLSYPLCLLFNLSFRKGKFQSAWKVAKITPIFKGKGSKATPGNYRPISLLSCISKLCERIFYDQLYSHVAPAIHPAQSGFRRGDSTSLQLTRLVQDIIGARAEKLYTGICFFDLAKAFDTVWHRGLLRKLQVIFNISDTPLKWIESYLSGRSQFVSVSGADSPKLPVLSGVPQGSILGPLLPSHVSGMSLFADDTAASRHCKTVKQLESELQNAINMIVTWMSSWRLRANVSKARVLFLTDSASMFKFTFPNSPTEIQTVKEHKHLGAMFDSSMSWSAHVDYIKFCNKVSRAPLKFIIRKF